MSNIPANNTVERVRAVDRIDTGPRFTEADAIRLNRLFRGTDTLEIHKDAIGQGNRVIIADDLLATGGTARAVVGLVEKLGGTVAGLAFVVELTFLKGRERFNGYKISSLLKYDE